MRINTKYKGRHTCECLSWLQCFLDERTSSLYQHQAVPNQLLEDEAFATKEARCQCLREKHLDLSILRSSQKGTLLTDQLAAVFGKTW